MFEDFWPPWFLSFARPNGRQGPINRITLRSLHPTPTPPKGPGFWGFLDPKGGFFKSATFWTKTIKTSKPKAKPIESRFAVDTHRPKYHPIHNWSPLRVWPDQTTIGPYRSPSIIDETPMTPKRGQKTPLRNGFFGWFQPNAGRLQKNTPFLRFFA